MLVENPFAAAEKTERGILSLLQEDWQTFLLRTFKMVSLDLTAGNHINCAALEEKTERWPLLVKVELVKLKVKSYRHIPAKNNKTRKMTNKILISMSAV